MSLATEFPEEYEAAKHLIENGVPLFLARRAAEFPAGGSDDKMGYHLPTGWQLSKPDLRVLEHWKPTDALCAVMGHIVDGLDVDPRNGGEALEHGMMPTSYGQQRTPSGGTHDLIASLGVRSKDNAFPGVDVKAGRGDARGRGFLFLAPTEKRSKVTGKIDRYRWTTPPDLDTLSLMGFDDSGEALKAALSTTDLSEARGYAGPDFDHLDARHQAMARTEQEDTLFDWKAKLEGASLWDEGQRDGADRGWEALARDFQWVVVCMAVCPWTPLTEAEAEDTYLRLMPEAMLADASCRKRFYEGIFDKASSAPVNRPPWWAESIFEQTGTLQQIRDVAFHAGRNPSGVLACVLARVLMEVPVTTTLPPLGGAPAALNLGVAVVGGPSDGKSTSFSLSARVLGFIGQDQRTTLDIGIGSGEGLIDRFLEPEKVENDKGKLVNSGNTVLKADPRAVFVCDEVDELAALGAGRTGSTLTSTIRKALTGDLLSTANSTAGGKYRRVPSGTYRTVVMMGVQPARAEVILDEVHVGTPQRFLWANASRSSVPAPEDRPAEPEMLDWTPPTDWPEFVSYPDSIRREIERRAAESAADWMADNGLGHLEGVRLSLESRQDLTRLKVATALAALHGETSITEQWWRIAGVLLEQSITIQMACITQAMNAAAKTATARAVSALKSQTEASGIVSEDRVKRCVEKVLTALKRKGEGEHPWDDIKPNSRYLAGVDKEDLFEALKAHPEVEVEEYEAQGRTARRFTYTEQKEK